MNYKSIIITATVFLFINCTFAQPNPQHEIIFCGERIPVQDRFVADKLMTVIRKQINYGVVAQLRLKENEYMKTIEHYLEKTGLPADLKYLPIVESGLRNVVSSAGAAGFWQIMKVTAGDLNLVVNGEIDERNDLNKSTYAACKLLAQYYLDIRKNFGISSWVLTAAAYNNGIGNIRKAISKQGKNYFEMNLNKETADYVYKIIALKELFEYPELYMKDFEFNIFNTKQAAKAKNASNGKADNINIGMTVKVDENDGIHPVNLNKKLKPLKRSDPSKVKFVAAEIKGKYKKFKDGDLVSFTLNDDLQVYNHFTAKGTVIQGRGWIIDDRVQVDLGHGHNVVLLDLKNEKGIALKSLKNSEVVILKVITKE